ncbi:DUF362 domain-containing protein [Candidatus Pacearchaeota archaeon]|nr:DUF362 domain-containing protein [Candidatus Pacearchaeota archaeon]MBD3282989.1 DUF362 domain-containing protein [Candidatus Pacearchaeota archaeon]
MQEQNRQWEKSIKLSIEMPWRLLLDKMPKVYFSENINKIIEKIDFSKLGETVAIKVHFGEKGCRTYINPEIVKKVYDKVTGLGKKAVLAECNVLYRGSRTNLKDHLETAKKHGFDFAEIDILDGDIGEKFLGVNVGGISKSARLGKGIERYDSMIVLTHFKGHMASGYGGAFKNIGVGLASRAGKLHIHSNVSPFINVEKCKGCGVCIENCKNNAIKLINNKSEIDREKCTRCAVCIAVCPEKAVRIPWGNSTSEELCKKIVDYSYGIVKSVPNIVYINVLENITEECDCMGIEQEKIVPDIGILLSSDIVLIDKASLDLVNKKSNGKFNEINSVDKNLQIDYAFLREMGEKEYEFIDLDKE